MRRVTLEVGGRPFQTAVDDAVRLSIPLDFDGDQPRAFGLPPAAAETIDFGDALCDTERGGDFNAERLSIIPHGNGTHTETVGHLVDDEVPVGAAINESLIPCTILSANPGVLDETPESYRHESEPTDRVVTREQLALRAASLDLPEGFLRALILRTHRDDRSPQFRDYSGTNPPYPTTEAVDWVVEQNVDHLLTDLPSLDRERDGGALANHRAFWGLAPGVDEQDPPSSKTITEFVHVPQSVPDGVYFLDIQVPDFEADAAPSRPLLYEAIPAD